MTSSSDPIVVIGGGPAGMAATLALLKTGRDVRLYERYREARPAGIILNLWPPPIRALGEMGVDMDDIGAPCHSTFRNAQNKVRADVKLPQEVLDEYHGGFVGLLRPDLYRRMLAAIPEGVIVHNKAVTELHDRGDHVEVVFQDGTSVTTPVVIGSDGIDSTVRKHLWGDSPKREHHLQALGGYTVAEVPTAEKGEAIIAHGAEIQASYSSIRTRGQDGFEWWTVEPWFDEPLKVEDVKAHALELVQEFGTPMTDLVAKTDPRNFQSWIIRDRVPLGQWSRGRITISGDAAHPTSPYAAYGAGMAICDGYFVAKALRGVDLADSEAVAAALVAYETKRIPHTASQVEQAYALGQQFHHTPKDKQAERDAFLDNTPFLQEIVGDKSPGEIVEQLQEMGEDVLAPA